MKQQVKIVIKGQEYPCRVTLGAMRRFKKMTGNDISALKGDDIDGLITFMYCCTASACNADGVEFNLSIDDFADNLSNMDDFVREVYGKTEGSDEQKKTTE